ncbi:hypothetical protein Tco_1409487 [Tanacetum coccineum]
MKAKAHGRPKVEDDDELGTKEGNSKLGEKGANFDVVSFTYGNSSEAFGSPNTSPLAARINDLERQMMDVKLVLVDDDGKPLKPSRSNIRIDSEVDEVFNETASYMTSTSSKNETYNEDPYDDDGFDDCGLTHAQMKFSNAFDISLHG